MSAKLFDKVGTVQKTGNKMNTSQWHERIFAYAMKKRIILYFRTQEDFKNYVQYQIPSYTAGSIELMNTNLFLVNYLETPTPWAFEICTLERNYYCCCRTEEEMQDWVLTLAAGGVALKTPHRPTPESLTLDAKRVFGMQGFMKKRGGWNTSWQKRFFRTLQTAAGSNVIAYYDTYRDKEPKGTILLDGAGLSHKAKSDADATDLDIVITTSEREFVLQCFDEASKKQWWDVIASIIDGTWSSVFKLPESEKVQEKIDMASKNLYEVLEVHPAASVEEINAAYKRMARKYHPDRNPGNPVATDIFQLVNEAQEVLLNSSNRMQYDQKLAEGVGMTLSALRRKWKEEYGGLDSPRGGPAEAEFKEPATFAPGRNSLIGRQNLGTLQSQGNATGDNRKMSVQDHQASIDNFLSDQRNMCEICTLKPKSFFCLMCRVDMCMQCSMDLHQSTESKKHKRVPMSKKEKFLELVATPGTKENRDALKREKEIAALIEEAKANGTYKESDFVTELSKAQIAERRAAALAKNGDAAAAQQARQEAASHTAAASAKPVSSKPSAKPASDVQQIEAAVDNSQAVVLAGASPSAPDDDEDYEAKKESNKRTEMDPLDEDALELGNGSEVWKLPTWGDAKKTKVFIKKNDSGEYVVAWESKKKKLEESSLLLKNCQLLKGQTTDLFRKDKFQKQFGDQTGKSFSLLGKDRNLDVVFLSPDDFEKWVDTIEGLLKRYRK